MHFERILPYPNLQRIIESYWVVENEDPSPQQEKIIPDGFTEIIFHNGGPYRIRIDGTWQLQSKSLLAGQISRHFFLENTGASAILGIKLKPTALTHLYNLSMNDITDSVVKARPRLGEGFGKMENQLRLAKNQVEKIAILNYYFGELLKLLGPMDTPADRAVNILFKHHGMLSIGEVCEKVEVGERQLENVFKKYVGLSPKLFARILRFNYIFQLLKENNQTWSDLAYKAAFYDQSHFIRNFKTFTGESPGQYPFEKKNMANFFLR